MDSNCVTYHIDNNNIIVYLSDNWDQFAKKNKGDKLVGGVLLNKSLYDSIADWRCQHLYKLLINRALLLHQTVKFPYRCDSPEFRRFMTMEITQLENSITEFRSCVVREEAREPQLLLDPYIPRSSEFLLICSWCNKVNISKGSWLEIEDAVKKAGLFDTELLPNLTHGVCPACFQKIQNEFAL